MNQMDCDQRMQEDNSNAKNFISQHHRSCSFILIMIFWSIIVSVLLALTTIVVVVILGILIVFGPIVLSIATVTAPILIICVVIKN